MIEFYARGVGGCMAVSLLMQLCVLPARAASLPGPHNVSYTAARSCAQEELPLKKVLTLLEARYKVRINYTGNTIKDMKAAMPAPISANVKMLDYLRHFLAPLNLEAEEEGTGYFVIYRKEMPAEKPSTRTPQPIPSTPEKPATRLNETIAPPQEAPAHPPVKGQVTQEDGIPIPGVTVVVKGTRTGIQTNADGRFELKDVPENAILVFSYIGYKTQEIRVGKRMPVAVTLLTDMQSLKDVVVNGYQNIKKDNFTGSAVTITGEELKRFNPQNILASIQSFDPSFKLVENNIAGSNPNALPNINVRGTTSMPSGANTTLSRNQLSSITNLPLFVIDGYPVPVQSIYDLDPGRIAAVTLLKDAAATAVYGSRAANGVLVITTRPPKEGKLTLYYNYELNVTTPDLTAYQLLDGAQKLEYERLAGIYQTSDADDPDNLQMQYYAKRRNVLAGVNTYWLSQPLSTDLGHKHAVSLEGGTSSLKYIIDGRYQTNAGVMKGSGRDRYSLATNLQYNLNNNKVLFRNQFTISQVNGRESPYREFSNYARMNPYYPKTDSTRKLLREVDSWKFRDAAAAGEVKLNTVLNPMYEATIGSFNKSEYLEFIDAFSAEYNITSALRLRSEISLTKRKSSADIFISPLSNDFFDKTGDDLKDRGTYTFSNRDEMQLDGNLVLNYNKGVGKHFFNTSLGINMQDSKSSLKVFKAQGFTNDRFTDITFARSYEKDKAPTGETYEERLAGAFGSINYAYENRYLMDATLRVDGSSKFGADARMAPFWSLGLGWNVHNEKFLRHTIISQLKLRATTGLTGEVSFPAYLSNTTYEYYKGDWYSTGVGAHFKAFGNAGLKWQRTRNYDLGMELGLLHDRVFFSPRYYYKLTKDLLADINVAPSTGFYQYKENLGEMVNKGYEFNVRVNVLRKRELSVNVNANMVHNTNVITKISNALKSYNDDIDKQQSENPDLQSVALLRYKEGQSMNTIYAVKSLGIDPENGKEIFLNPDGTKTYEYNVKNTVPVGDQTPQLEGFFGGNVVYKNFMLEVSFYTKFGGDYYNQTLLDRVENADPRYNVDARVLSDRWQHPGDITFYKNIADQSTTQASSRFVQKENRLEFKAVYLSYEAPKALYERLKMKSLRFSLNMNDIGYWSTVAAERGIDYPFARSFTFSLQTRF
ncbi:SusC/RagA family TonB-linked outer membrane protein [Chitinophaga sp. 22321]|uniref:SusC/RagA family TonB-linked outer membrane protein n=1 Tax=Chitinophaga hostae TaxID=2831022 RepID=A0ABS5J8E1_9BACT|nr:SusC/RagA family TonB-linked outer membrane protein [Chitinophaga hostae]MBS0031490.1 SusC/RagA family TonB-linked outer membrane protein [Chitinophaga hostae]